MTQGHGLPDEVAGLLAYAVDAHLASTPADHALVRLLCKDAVAFARDHDAPHTGRRARAAAALLLELGCPELSPDVRAELAVICELTALGAAVRLRQG